jgi:hypothetical protein
MERVEELEKRIGQLEARVKELEDLIKPSARGLFASTVLGAMAPLRIRGKNARMIKQDLLNGERYYPIISKGLGSRFKEIGYLKVNIRNLEGRLTMDTENIRVEDIANLQWKEASEKYKLQERLEWHCVEAAYRNFTLVRCMTDNLKVGTVREVYFLKLRAEEDRPSFEEQNK